MRAYLTRAGALAIAIVAAGCSTTLTGSEPTQTASPTLVATTASPEQSPSPWPSPSPTTPASPPQLLGSWRTTLGGETVTLFMSEANGYRIQRGVNVGTGDILVEGDRIDFFNSTLCRGTGEYRWRIEGDSLRFSVLDDPCPGRAEALLNVRYSDYVPPR